MSFTDGTSAGGPAEARTEDEAEKEEGNSAERLLLFTDAVAAIAITLLILPLVDLVPEVAGEHGNAREVITEHRDQIGSFVLSFLVISGLWLAHHRLFAGVRSYNQPLVLWNMAWLFSIIVLPFPTEMVGAFGGDRLASSLYYANVLAGVACQTAMIFVLKRTPRLLRPGSHDMGHVLRVGVTNVVALVIAFALALAVPALQYYSLLLLAVAPWTERLRKLGSAR
ncbi:TMEM175 family protein [Streptomyces sp. 150FB]|uniref:TMEM175 family protein n=1 Tax=Streptomyces sp. 150FB TaxID=1576605 RepID=UPI000A48BCF5|nr:TMEM175 family protein [Streptomyces sp. 150FB]